MKKFFSEAKGHLMTGIGYMLPLIIGASLVVAIPLIIALCTGVSSLDPYASIKSHASCPSECVLFGSILILGS